MNAANDDKEVVDIACTKDSCFEIRDGVPILAFDHSVENFLDAMETIQVLCGRNKEDNFEASEIEHFKSGIAFLRDWKQFYFCEWMSLQYRSKIIDFSFMADSERDTRAINGINLPHFSSAAVPKKQMEELPDAESSPEIDDFVLHVGGSVWALDWCPQFHKDGGSDIKCEYLAVAVHPIGSEYHKIGEQLSGRGFIQIWCFLHLFNKEESAKLYSRDMGNRGRRKKCALSSPNGAERNLFDIEVSNARSNLRGDFDVNEANLSDDNHIERPRKRGRPKRTPVPKICKPRGRPRKCALAIQNNVEMEGSYAPSSSKVLTSGDSCVLKESHRNKIPRSLYGSGDVDVNKEARSEDHHTESSRKHKEDPSKASIAKAYIPCGKPGKRPNFGSYESAVIYDDQLMNSSLLSDSRDMGNLNGQGAISFACFKAGSKNGVTSLNDSSGRVDGRKQIHDYPDLTADDFDVPLASFLLRSSNGKRKSFGPRHRKNCKESSLPCENSVVGSSEDNLPTLPMTVGCEAPKESAVTERVIEDKNGEVKGDTTVTDNGNDQALETSGWTTKEKSNGLKGRKLPLRKKKILNTDKFFVSAYSPFIVECGLEPTAQPSHCWELVTKKPSPSNYFFPEDIALPRLVLSLAHNGKVAWDLKWRPSEEADSKGTHHIGYLAVLLGNGSLEVWEVPMHSVVKLLYAACRTEDTDPRFLKLQPVFSCSGVKFRDRQSIPLALEWSPFGSHDLILVGCHDGTVALWKFHPQHSPQDTKPLQCFTAEIDPIRALAWAPAESDAECSNLIVTAGHGGVKFWDLRDPYRPLWDLYPVQRAVLSIDWLNDPRCVIIAYEDGTMRLVSLTKIANDVPVTGEILTRTKQSGLHCYVCSSFAIWSVQVSRSTGLVAYCSADGCTRHFQLTTKAVEKDGSRYRAPHFLCGSFTEEGSCLKIVTPWTSSPLPKHSSLTKKSIKETIPSKMSLPALCWNDDHTTNSTSCTEHGNASLSKPAENAMGEAKQTVLCFPPKSVALHKVRWNMNKGSGRWLCYGGAAGIVRCQAISSRSLQ